MSVFSALPLFALIREKFYTTPSPALRDTDILIGAVLTGRIVPGPEIVEKSIPNFSGDILPFCNADILCFISTDKKFLYLSVCNLNITRAGLMFGRRWVILNLILGKHFLYLTRTSGAPSHHVCHNTSPLLSSLLSSFSSYLLSNFLSSF